MKQSNAPLYKNRIKLLFGSAAVLALAGCAARQDVAETQPAPSAPNQAQEAQAQTVGSAEERDSTEQVIVTGSRLEPMKFAGKPASKLRARQIHSLIDRPGFLPPSQPDRENYAHVKKNPISAVADDPISTFSVDVDTGSYSLVRDRLNQGILPNPDAVRTEELINYFSYDYGQPTGHTPFSVTTDAMITPWNQNTYLLRIGLQGKKMLEDKRPAANLVLLLDVSGSMAAPDKLPLLTRSLSFMAGQLREDDRVSIVVYAGAAGLVLDVTKGTETATIRNALSGLGAGGSTAGGAGIQLAYAKAKEAFIEGGINRVLLATDGDFNVGTTGVEELKKIVAANRESGISLSTLGFGDGNFNDHLMEQVAGVGNGNYAYIDNFREAKKVLGDQLSSTIYTIAKDVKIQVEFNPAVVAEYRLIGYENRVLADEDFTNDKVDAGEIGAGHSVTALYEIALVGSDGVRLPARRYATGSKKQKGKKHELGFVKLRYKAPDGDTSQQVSEVMAKNILTRHAAPVPGLRHAAAVAAYGQLLSGSKYMDGFSFGDLIRLVQHGDGFSGQHHAEFLALLESAQALKEMQTSGR